MVSRFLVKPAFASRWWPPVNECLRRDLGGCTGCCMESGGGGVEHREGGQSEFRE